MIAEKIKSVLSIQKRLQEKEKENKNIYKPLKPIDSPAIILVIDGDICTDSDYEDFIHSNFLEDVENNILNFRFAEDFSQAAKQIQINPPDLIISELVILPLCEIINDGEENIVKDGMRLGYGLNVFKLLDKLDLEFRIPVIFYGALGDCPEYKKKAEKLGAFACLERDPSSYDRSLKMAIKKALNI